MAPASPFAFPSQLKPLKRDLRADRPFDPDDGKTVGDALSTLGVGDSDLFSSIKRFQKQHGLKVDGWMKPNGPTQKTLNAVLAGGIGAGIPQGKDKADWLTQHALPQDIVGFDFDKGEAGRNAPGDLMKVKRGFGALIPGKLGRLFEDNPDDFGETVEMIKQFQRGAGLKESGWMAPGDDTTKAFAENLRRILPQLADKRSEELANVDPGFLWQRLRGERAPKDKSLFPKGYRNWREMKELGETGSKVPHLIDQLAEKNARADLDYKIDSNFKAESQRIHGLTLLRAAEKDRGGDKRPTPEPSEEESSEPSDSLAPASESDTLTPVPPSDTTETESKEETPAEETPWSLDQVPIVEVKDEELLPAFIAAAREKEVGVNQPIKTSFEYDPNGLPEIGLGIPAMLWNADTRRYELRRDEYSAAGANMAEAQWAELQTYADTLTQWRLDLAKGQDKATAAATVFSALVESGLEEEASDQLTKVLDGLSQGTDVADRFPVKRNSDFLSAAEALDTILSSKKLSDADRAALAAASDYLKAAGTPVRSRAEAEYPPASTFTTSWSEATAEQFVFDFMRSGAYEEMVIAGIGQDNFDRLNAKQRAELLTVSWLDMGHMKNKVGPLLKDSLEADWRAQEAAAAKGETLSCAWPNTFKAIKENPKRDQKWQAGYDNRFRLTAEGFTGCS